MLSTQIMCAKCSCIGEERTHVIKRIFEETHRVIGKDEIRAEDIDRLMSNVPWYARIPWKKYIVPKGGSAFALKRCGENGRITRSSSMEKVDTCISKCIFVSILNKFIDWGFADYAKAS